MAKGNGKAAGAIALTIKAGEATALLQAYGALDGYDTIIGEGKEARVVRTPYAFGSGRTYLRVAKALNALRAVAGEAEQARQALLKPLIPEGKSVLTAKDDPTAWARYEAGVKEIMASESAVTLDPIDIAELGDQPVPPSVLGVLLQHGLVTE